MDPFLDPKIDRFWDLKTMTVRVSVNHQRLVCLENSRIEPTPEQVRPNFWNWKESEGGVQHRFYATSLHAIFLRNRAIFTRSCSTY